MDPMHTLYAGVVKLFYKKLISLLKRAGQIAYIDAKIAAFGRDIPSGGNLF